MTYGENRDRTFRMGPIRPPGEAQSLQQVQCRLDEDREDMLGLIDRYLAMPEKDRRIFQLARRKAVIISPEEVSGLPADRLMAMEEMAERTADSYRWSVKLNDMMCRFI